MKCEDCGMVIGHHPDCPEELPRRLEELERKLAESTAREAVLRAALLGYAYHQSVNEFPWVCQCKACKAAIHALEPGNRKTAAALLEVARAAVLVHEKKPAGVYQEGNSREWAITVLGSAIDKLRETGLYL